MAHHAQQEQDQGQEEDDEEEADPDDEGKRKMNMKIQMPTKMKMEKKQLQQQQKKKSPTTTTTASNKTRTCPSCFCMLDPICYGWHIKKCSFNPSALGDGKRSLEEKPRNFSTVGNGEVGSEKFLCTKAESDLVLYQKLKEKMEENHAGSSLSTKELKKSPEHGAFSQIMKALEEKPYEDSEGFLYVQGLKSTISALKEENDTLSQKMKSLIVKPCMDSDIFLCIQGLKETVSDLRAANDVLFENVKILGANPNGHSESVSCIQGLKTTISELEAENHALSQKVRIFEEKPHCHSESVLCIEGLKTTISELKAENGAMSQKVKSLEENPFDHSKSFSSIQGLKATIFNMKAGKVALPQGVEVPEGSSGLKSTIYALKAENDVLLQKVKDLQRVKEELQLQLQLSKEAERKGLSLIESLQVQLKEKEACHQGFLGFSLKCGDMGLYPQSHQIGSILGTLQHGMEKLPYRDPGNVPECFRQEEQTINDEKAKVFDLAQKGKDLVTVHKCHNEAKRSINDEMDKLVGQGHEEKDDHVINDVQPSQHGMVKPQSSQIHDLVIVPNYSSMERSIIKQEKERLTSPNHEENDDGLSTLQHRIGKPPCAKSGDRVDLQEHSDETERVPDNEKERLVDQRQEEKDVFLIDVHLKKKEELDLNRIVSLTYGEEAHLQEFPTDMDATGVKLVMKHGNTMETVPKINGIDVKIRNLPNISSKTTTVSCSTNGNKLDNAFLCENHENVTCSHHSRMKVSAIDTHMLPEKTPVSLAYGEEARLQEFPTDMDAGGVKLVTKQEDIMETVSKINGIDVKIGNLPNISNSTITVSCSTNGNKLDSAFLCKNHENVTCSHHSRMKTNDTDTRMLSEKTPVSEVKVLNSLSGSPTSGLYADTVKGRSHRRIMFGSESDSENESLCQQSADIKTPEGKGTCNASKSFDMVSQNNQFGTVFSPTKRPMQIDFGSEGSPCLDSVHINNKIETLQGALKADCTPNWSDNVNQKNGEVDGYEPLSAGRRKKLRTLSFLSAQKDARMEARLSLSEEKDSSGSHGKVCKSVGGYSLRTGKRLFEDKCRNNDTFSRENSTSHSGTSSSLDGFIVDSEDEEVEREEEEEVEEDDDKQGSDSSDGTDSTSRTSISETEVFSYENDMYEGMEGWFNKMRRMRKEKMSTYAWSSEAEMRSVLDADDELCLRAVCALYRRQTGDEREEKASKYLNKRGFNSTHAARGSRYARFLTNDDPFGPVKKSVEDLEKYDPSAFEYCRMLTFTYSKQLFDIYVQHEDPYFPC